MATNKRSNDSKFNYEDTVHCRVFRIALDSDLIRHFTMATVTIAIPVQMIHVISVKQIAVLFGIILRPTLNSIT